MMGDYYSRTARWEFKRDESNGLLIGPSGCHYENERAAMYYDQLNLCGCGRPTDVHAFIVRCLSARKDDSSNIIDVSKVEDAIRDNPGIVAEMFMHFMERLDITEHGGSVYGSWLTERGKQLVEIGPMSDQDDDSY